MEIEKWLPEIGSEFSPWFVRGYFRGHAEQASHENFLRKAFGLAICEREAVLNKLRRNTKFWNSRQRFCSGPVVRTTRYGQSLRKPPAPYITLICVTSGKMYFWNSHNVFV